jgi:hypothetical protein
MRAIVRHLDVGIGETAKADLGPKAAAQIFPKQAFKISAGVAAP